MCKCSHCGVAMKTADHVDHVCNEMKFNGIQRTLHELTSRVKAIEEERADEKSQMKDFSKTLKKERCQKVDIPTLKIQAEKLRQMHKALVEFGKYSGETKVIFMSKDSGCVYVKDVNTSSSFPNVTLGKFRGNRNFPNILSILDEFDKVAQRLNSDWDMKGWVTGE